MPPSASAVPGVALGQRQSLGVQLCPPGVAGSPWLRPGSAALAWVQMPNSNGVVVQTAPCGSHGAPVGQGMDNLPFSLGKKPKPCGLLTHVVASASKHGAEGCLPPSLPSLPLCRGCSWLSWHFIPQKRKQRVGLSRKAWRSSVCCLDLCGVGYF